MKKCIKICLALSALSLTCLTYGQIVPSPTSTLQAIEKNTGETSNRVGVSNSLLGAIKSSLVYTTQDGKEWYYLIDIRNYVKEIYDWLTNGVKDIPKNTWRYLAMQKVEDATRDNISQISEKMSNLVQHGTYSSNSEISKKGVPAYPSQALLEIAAARKDKFPEEKSSTTYYSAYSPESLYSTDTYLDENQQYAAEAFVQNAAANIAIPTLDQPLSSVDKGSKQYKLMLDYIAYQKTMSAIQGSIASNLLRSYAERIPVEIVVDKGDKGTIKTSKTQLINEINVADPSDPDYWLKGIGSEGLIQRVFSFFTSFFSINYSLTKITSQLEHANIQLSLLLSETLLLAKASYGDMLYEKVQNTSATFSSRKAK